ncbi:MAG: DUF4874 domain-containing protein [Clostridiales bacterium]|nr:DUF4874 domain-containing protein [Clostridiales bacterium]
MKRLVLAMLVLTMLTGLIPAMAETIEFSTPALPGEKREELLKNPDRGLRLELYLSLGSGKYVPELFDAYGNLKDPSTARSAWEVLNIMMADYAPESPRVAQAYFYLTEYRNRDLDQTAFDNMNAYFQACREYGITLALRFVYIFNQGYDRRQDVVSLSQMMRHMEQLKPILEANRDCISFIQCGFFGEWGETSPNSQWVKAGNTGDIINGVVRMAPKDVPVTVRYTWIRDEAAAPLKARIGYHDDYIIGYPHAWATGGYWDTEEHQEFIRNSSKVLVEGEMPWGGQSPGGVDIWNVAKYLADRHFSVLSCYHSYREYGVHYNLYHARSTLVTPESLAEHGLPVPYEAWFRNGDGTAREANLFEYIQYFLGYHMQMDNARADIGEDKITLSLDMTNYGFAAPLLLKGLDAVLVDENGQIVASKSLGKLNKLLPGTHALQAEMDLPGEGNYRLGVRLYNAAGTGAKLANDLPFENGINFLGEIQ